MADNHYIVLETRDIFAISGTDAPVFLQNLISNDVERVSESQVIYATLLTPQGKFLHDFFVMADPRDNQSFLIETDAGRIDDLEKRLTMYRLRADVTFARVPDDWAVVAAFGETAAQTLDLEAVAGTAAVLVGGIAFVDPRLSALGVRAVGPVGTLIARLGQAGFIHGTAAAYERLRLSLGVPDGSRDILVEKSFPLECNLEEFNAVDYEKGCYVGQELTARTHYRAKIRKRLIPVQLEGPLPAAGTPVTLQGREIGEMRSGDEQLGLALLRIDALKAALDGDEPLMAGATQIIPNVPAWLDIDHVPEVDLA